MENKLELVDISKNFRKKNVLKSLSCTLENGIYGFLAPNGAGKTTLMRCITGLYSYDGKVLLNEKPAYKQKHDIGYLPQKFGVFPELTVKQMMEYFCNLKEIPKKERDELITESLRHVNLENEKNVMAKKLSGGMIRRLGIAQAILGTPKLILLDEPTAGLDPEERMRFKNIINSVSKESIVLISTHIVEDVEACCDRIIVMKNGQILKEGPINDISAYAEGRICELSEESINDDNILFVEKSYLKDGKKVYRVIMKDKGENIVKPNVEDGYLCLLKD